MDGAAAGAEFVSLAVGLLFLLFFAGAALVSLAVVSLGALASVLFDFLLFFGVAEESALADWSAAAVSALLLFLLFLDPLDVSLLAV